MCAQIKKEAPGLLWSVFRGRCPRCRRGHLFTDPNPYHLKNTVTMPHECAVCGQKFELETGFYFGTGYVSYAFTVLITGLSFVLWKLTLGISLDDNSIFWWLGANAVLLVLLQPVLQRLSRSAWIAFFVGYNPDTIQQE